MQMMTVRHEIATPCGLAMTLAVRSALTSLLLLLLVATTVSVSATAAGADFPNRPVRLVVPFVPGGAADIVGRMLAQKLSDSWGVSMVVDNRSGAAGNMGTSLVASASPDGYTMLMGNVGPLAINP